MTEGLKIIPLGGLGEIGLNMMVLEYGEDIMVIDCGLMFPEDYMLGVDYVIPDATYLKEKKERIRAYVITHGHEDHTGALPFILKDLPAPVYGTALTLGLIEEKLKEHGLKADMRRVRPRDVVEIGPFRVEFIRVSHSIVDGVGLAITTPVGVIVHTGDFKFDQTPVDGEFTDYSRFAEYGEKGVLALLSDSTNVEKEGYTLSEREVGRAFEEIFAQASGRIIVAVFSSNLHRIQQAIDVAERFGRKVALSGRSMVANVKIANRLGYLRLPEGMIVDIKDVEGLPPNEVAILTTGSQGEPMSALTRMAMNEHRQVRIKRGDTVILSAKFIPGHEKAISTLINHLYRRGAEVFYEKVSEIHVSGHAGQEELKIMLNIVRPKFFIPIHGEYRHLIMHGRLAEKVGIPKERVLVIEDGDVLEFNSEGVSIGGKVPCGKVFVDGKGVGDVGELVLKDRLHLSTEGIVVPLVVINEKTGEILYGPEIVTKGFVFEEESGDLLEEAKRVVLETIGEVNPEARTEWLEIKVEIRRALRRFFNKAIERRPLISPLIIEI